MNRVYIVTALAVVVVAAALGGSYQFYFKGKIDEYREHQMQKERLVKKLTDLESTFAGVKPERLVQEWKQQVNPWFNAVADEGRFFEFGVEAVPPVPPEVVSPRLYYKDEYEKMMRTLHQEAYPRAIPFTNFGVYDPNAIPNNTATREEVRDWLNKLHFGQEMIRLLLANNVVAIENIDVWPDKVEQDGMLVKRTVGARFVIALGDLVSFLEQLRSAERYYAVEAIRVSNPYLMTSPPPPVTVEMLLTLARFDAQKLEAVPAASASASSYASPMEALNTFGIRQGEIRMPQQSGFQRWWRNFRKRYLPF